MHLQHSYYYLLPALVGFALYAVPALRAGLAFRLPVLLADTDAFTLAALAALAALAFLSFSFLVMLSLLVKV